MSYKYENSIQMGFSDGYVERRISKNQFFLQVNQLIAWHPIEKELKTAWPSTACLRCPLLEIQPA